jgi:uncharacterized protein YjbI with pentapeptide repeats
MDRTDLSGADLRGAVLTGVTFKDARVDHTAGIAAVEAA